MAVTVYVPTPLRAYTNEQESVQLEGGTVGEVLRNLTREYTELKRHLYTEDGRLRNFVNVYVNDEDIRYLNREETAVKDTDRITIVPSVAGGSVSVEKAEETLTHEELQRYSRHLIMPEVGLEGQKKLKAAKVLCIGAGGLGSPLALYLAAAGVGRLGIVDFDAVEISNLQRQIIHSTADLGRPKLESAADKIRGINPHVQVDLIETRLTSENALEIFAEYDIVADGTDNFPTRYLVNDACVMTGKPNVYGSIFRFEGQASVFALPDGPCYRCLYPEPPPPGLVPSCAEGGVLGILPGLIGVIQATEVIKLILGKGESLAGRLLLVDALGMTFRELKLRKNPECPVCGPNPSIRELIDYEQFCGIAPETRETWNEAEITATELKRELESANPPFVLDVRTPHEYQIARIPGVHLIPLQQLPARLQELDPARETVVYCRTGVRSAKAIEIMRAAGFQKLRNLKGGIHAWSDEVDPTVVKY
ncbi:MAG TPA: molybdopterin-synthase adenylyltransferase MoeB [Acidobacteriota bacterium]|nr:molybdopterin-synthase adenylyltransferase MoeB [Acidobacteriota bacterium]